MRLVHRNGKYAKINKLQIKKRPTRLRQHTAERLKTITY